MNLHITQKIALVLILPLLLLMSYHFFTIDKAFERISTARSIVFVQSAEEVKYASQVQNYSSLLTTKLFEISSYQKSNDSERLANAVQLYREIQQQRYHSFQQLKETVAQGAPASDQFLSRIDSNRDQLLQTIEIHIDELQSINEKIIGRLGLQPFFVGESDAELDALFLEAIPHARHVDEALGEFIEQRYLKVAATSKAVEEIEQQARATLLFGVLLGYLVAAVMIYYIHRMIVRPLEKFALLFAFDDPSKVDWAQGDRVRNDEIGQTLRGIETLYLRLQSKKKTASSEKKSTRKKKK